MVPKSIGEEGLMVERYLFHSSVVVKYRSDISSENHLLLSSSISALNTWTAGTTDLLKLLNSLIGFTGLGSCDIVGFETLAMCCEHSPNERGITQTWVAQGKVWKCQKD